VVFELVVHAPSGELTFELGQGVTRVGHDRGAGEFRCVERRHVDVYDLHRWVLEHGVRRRGEVAPARADTDDEVGVTGDIIGRSGTGGAEGPEARRVVKAK